MVNKVDLRGGSQASPGGDASALLAELLPAGAPAAIVALPCVAVSALTGAGLDVTDAFDVHL